MIEYERIDISEGIYTDKTNKRMYALSLLVFLKQKL